MRPSGVVGDVGDVQRRSANRSKDSRGGVGQLWGQTAAAIVATGVGGAGRPRERRSA
jgi:hypothetical protein